MRRWKAAALVSLICSSLLSVWMCQEGLLLGHRLGPALAPLRRPPRTLDARIARLAQCKSRPPEGGGFLEKVPGGGWGPPSCGGNQGTGSQRRSWKQSTNTDQRGCSRLQC
jgi:hypothetical protein